MVEMQLNDGQLLRVPKTDAKKIEPEIKAVTSSPENKAVKPNENKNKSK